MHAAYTRGKIHKTFFDKTTTQRTDRCRIFCQLICWHWALGNNACVCVCLSVCMFVYLSIFIDIVLYSYSYNITQHKTRNIRNKNRALESSSRFEEKKRSEKNTQQWTQKFLLFLWLFLFGVFSLFSTFDTSFSYLFFLTLRCGTLFFPQIF